MSAHSVSALSRFLAVFIHNLSPLGLSCRISYKLKMDRAETWARTRNERSATRTASVVQLIQVELAKGDQFASTLFKYIFHIKETGPLH